MSTQVDNILERMIQNLEKKVDRGFEKLDKKLDRYATKVALRAVTASVLIVFLLVLCLHGWSDVARAALEVVK